MPSDPQSNRQPAAIDPLEVPEETGSIYPDPFRGDWDQRTKRRIGNHFGLTQMGVNLVHLPPGSESAIRHWHASEDEFVYVIEGELVLVTDGGEQTLRSGMTAGFPAGRADGHKLVNRGGETAVYLEVGSRPDGDDVTYPDDDLRLLKGDGKMEFVSADGSALDGE